MIWAALLAATIGLAGSSHQAVAQTTPEPRVTQMPMEREDDDMDWGWIGLLGLAGLLGLRGRERYDRVNRTTTRTTP
jgi:MYXO-CTERM domain-containing protein